MHVLRCPVLLLVLMLLGSARPASPLQEPAEAIDWPATWRELARLEELRADGAKDPRTADELARSLAARSVFAGDRPRGAILAAHLARLAGEVPHLELDRLPHDLGPGEAWLAAQVLEPGVVRARAYAAALHEAAGRPEYGPRVQAAFDAFGSDVEALRLQAAEILAVAMHETADASWSATSLALLSTRLGEHERADALLADRLARLGPGPSARLERVDLLQRRGIAALGAGWIEAARDHLGRALALGGTDATQILGRMALAEGQYERARRLFGALLVPAPTPSGAGTAEAETAERAYETTPWALRGWGLALLPAPQRQF